MERKCAATYIIKDTKREHFEDDASFDGLNFCILSLCLSCLLLDESLIFEGQFIISDNCIEHNLLNYT